MTPSPLPLYGESKYLADESSVAGFLPPPSQGGAGGESEIRNAMNVFDSFREKLWALIKRKAVEVIVAMLTAAITALTTTSCMGLFK